MTVTTASSSEKSLSCKTSSWARHGGTYPFSQHMGGAQGKVIVQGHPQLHSKIKFSLEYRTPCFKTERQINKEIERQREIQRKRHREIDRDREGQTHR